MAPTEILKSPASDAAPARRLWRLALGLWCALAVMTVAGLWHLRQDAIKGQERELSLLSTALTDEIDRGIRGAEEGLRALQTEMGGARLAGYGFQGRQALRTRADLMPLIDRLWVVDRGGSALSASEDAAVPDLKTFSPPLETLPDDAMALSRPFVIPHVDGTSVALAIRFGNPSVAPEGWIIAAMPAALLLGAFSVAAPAGDARMYVFRDDGVLLAGANAPPPRFDEATVAQRLARRPEMELGTFGDGTNHIVDQHNVDRYGLRVLVSRDLEALLAGWRSAVDLAAAGLLVIFIILAFAVRRIEISDRRHAEAHVALQDQLTRASKLESLGALAGGVAHDFNNVLAGIVGYGELAQDASTPGSEQARHIDRMLQAALRGKALIDRILTFSRGGARVSTVFDLQLVIEEVLTLLSATLRPGIVIERSLDAPDGHVKGDLTQAFEAIMNLCTNALQAMPEGGMLSVQTKRARVESDRILSHSQLVAGNYIALSVCDQGSGIAPDVMNHLFEPFFTTRGAHSGTGLGLAVVHGVVAGLGGAIDVETVPGGGACFTLYLPESAERLSESRDRQDVGVSGHGQRVAVVDDDPELVGLGLEMLSRLGYAPEGFIDAAAAIDALRAGAAYEAVVTDEAMPRMTGIQLTEAMRKMGSRIPVLLVSGHGGALLAERAAAAGVRRVLTKPLQRVDLARALSEVLQQAVR
jgi:signal transduction histidine kinase/ActR/RegA family two-component response regulator